MTKEQFDLQEKILKEEAHKQRVANLGQKLSKGFALKQSDMLREESERLQARINKINNALQKSVKDKNSIADRILRRQQHEQEVQEILEREEKEKAAKVELKQLK